MLLQDTLYHGKLIFAISPARLCDMSHIAQSCDDMRLCELHIVYYATY